MPYKEMLEAIVDNMRSEKKKLEKELKKLPDGRMMVHHRGNGFSYFQIDPEGRRHRIGRDKPLQDKLVQKELLTAQCAALDANINICSKACSAVHSSDNTSIIRELRHGLCNIQEERFFPKTATGLLIPNPVSGPGIILRQPVTFISDMTPEEWAIQPYQENTKHYDEKKHKGTNGLYYRSRAEMLIAYIYEKNTWNYHYDERLRTIDDVWLSPDFQHCNSDSKLLYHEHCELDEYEEYDSNFARKLGIYLSNGIKPGKNLIITWSKKDGSLDLQQIEKILKAYYD